MPLLPAIIGMSTCVLLVGQSRAATSLPTVATYSGEWSPGSTLLQVRPRSILYTADSSGFIAGRRRKSGPLHWTVWNRSGGKATGADWINDCVPDCAGGTYHGYAANAAVFRPRVLGGRDVFTRLRVRHPGKVPARGAPQGGLEPGLLGESRLRLLRLAAGGHVR